jgi:hypothetical protein
MDHRLKVGDRRRHFFQFYASIQNSDLLGLSVARYILRGVSSSTFSSNSPLDPKQIAHLLFEFYNPPIDVGHIHFL